MAGTSNFKTEEELQNTKILDAESLIEKLGNMCYSLEVISCQDDVVNINKNSCYIIIIIIIRV